MHFFKSIKIINPTKISMDAFGKKRLQDFYVDPTYINVNHGSYGLAPKTVIDYQHSLQKQCEFNTELWFRKDA